jgi:hypothetical protein
MRRGEVRKVLESLHDHPGFLDAYAAIRTVANVGLQGIHPEAHLVIVEEKIDLVWK